MSIRDFNESFQVFPIFQKQLEKEKLSNTLSIIFQTPKTVKSLCIKKKVLQQNTYTIQTNELL